MSATQLAKGFRRVEAALDDLKLDFPHAATVFSATLADGQTKGWLPANWRDIPVELSASGGLNGGAA